MAVPSPRHRALRAALALLLASAACDEEEPPIDDLVRSVGAELNAQIDGLCGSCAADLGYDDTDACAEDFGRIDQARERCMIDAYDRDRALSRRYLECIEPVQQAYTACLTERLDCSDRDAVMPCDDEYAAGREACVELPPTIEDALDDCFGGAAP